MPEMHFVVRWPDGVESRCYSPSLVVREHLEVGQEYQLPDFVARSRTMLNIGSERVRAKYGYVCTGALDQLAKIEECAATFDDTSRVTVVAFDPPGPHEPAKDQQGRQMMSSEPSVQAGVQAGAQPGMPPPGAHHSVIVIGGGQAGLAVSYCLKQRGIDHLVFEKHSLGHEWRERRWDSFCLVTPNWQCRLPGFPYDGPDPHGFMLKDAIVSYLEAYARSFDPPLLEGVAVTSLRHAPGGGFDLGTSTGETHADEVVIATGGYHIPSFPRLSERLPESIVQIHSSAYRNSGALPGGEVLVVGTGQSGCQIAEDLHLAGRRVHLCVGSAPRTARRYRGRDVVDWLEDMGYYRLAVEDHPLHDRVRAKANHYVTGRDGGRDIDLRQRAREGMRLYGRLTGVWSGRLEFGDDLKANLDQADAVAESIKGSIDKFITDRGIEAPTEPRYRPVWEPEGVLPGLDLAANPLAAVIWSTGYRTDYSWIALPIFDGRGYPTHRRGVTPVDGLYFIGLPWLHTWGSGRFSGVAADATYLVERIERRLGSALLPPLPVLNELALGS